MNCIKPKCKLKTYKHEFYCYNHWIEKIHKETTTEIHFNSQVVRRIILMSNRDTHTCASVDCRVVLRILNSRSNYKTLNSKVLKGMMNNGSIGLNRNIGGNKLH